VARLSLVSSEVLYIEEMQTSLPNSACACSHDEYTQIDVVCKLVEDVLSLLRRTIAIDASELRCIESSTS
jgi:hypothetical protein